MATAAPAAYQCTLPGTSQTEINAAIAALRAQPEAPTFESFQGTFATQEYLQATISELDGLSPLPLLLLLLLPPRWTRLHSQRAIPDAASKCKT